MGALAAQSAVPSGFFGFSLTTSFTDPTNQGGAAILGLMNFEGAGKLRGPFTLEYGSGGPLPATTITGTFAGTYSVNPNGTSSIKVTLSNGIKLGLALVIDDGGHGLELIATSCSGAAGIDLSASVLSGFGVEAKGYTSKSLAALEGSYGGQFTYSPEPFRLIGVASFDGAGNVTVSTTGVGSGPSVQSGSFTGAYTVSPNATGTITLAATPTQGVQTFVFVITDAGGPGLLVLQNNMIGNGVATSYLWTPVGLQ